VTTGHDRGSGDVDRAAVLRTAGGVGIATGAYGLSFGALATSSGLTVAQACALSVLMFTGGSQFALIGALGGGGGPWPGAASAVLLGARNGLYGARLAGVLRPGRLRPVAAQLVIDESTAVALGSETRGPRAARLGFWATGLAVFVLWNTTTLVGAVVGEGIGDPRDLGLDAAVPAAFLALAWPHLRGRPAVLTAAAAALVAVAVLPVVPPGVPVLVAAVVPMAAGWSLGRRGRPA
jgi:predicted branched-subunit amino acid permease